MITVQSWEILTKKQAKFDQLIVKKSPTNLRWISYFNAERLKLALLVEVGEFANEIKSFKAWRKKPEVDWDKAKEELIDCLGYFLGLIGVYQINMSSILLVGCQRKDFTFNKLLLAFFAKTNDLYVEKNEKFYNLENEKIGDKEKNTYYEWLKTFNRVCEKLQINEKELLNIYLDKYNKNLQRVHAK